MTYKCAITGYESTIITDFLFFDKEGEITSFEEAVTTVCESAVDMIEDYNEYANIHYCWNNLDEQQQKELWPYIHVAWKTNKFWEVFGIASDDQEVDGFDGWLDAVKECTRSEIKEVI